MGTYISIPYVTRRSVHVEQSKPVATDKTTYIEAIPEAEPKADQIDAVKEEPIDVVKEEPKEEAKVEVKEEPAVTKNVIVEAEEVIPELLPKQLSISIPSESEAVPDFSEKVIVPPRIPEFQGNMNSESHAIKKFNRRHRKHQQN
jgi:hypothetical protein